MDSCINYLRSYIYKWVLIILIASYYVSFRNIIYQPLKILLKLSARICCFRATSVGSGCFGQFTQHSSVMGFAPQGTLLSAFVVPHACVALVQDTYSTFPDLQKIHEKIKKFLEKVVIAHTYSTPEGRQLYVYIDWFLLYKNI